MSDDVLITPASRKIEFKDNAGNVDGKIELDGNGNLNITSPGGDIGLGDPTADVFIGDGTNNVDIVFEQNGEIRGLAGKTLTIGQADSNVTVTAQNFAVTDGMTLDGGTLILGDDAYSTSANYVGMKTSAMTGSQDYMIISGHSGVDHSTYISAKSDADVFIRGGGNVSTPQIQLDTSAGDIIMTGDVSISGSITAGSGLGGGGFTEDSPRKNLSAGTGANDGAAATNAVYNIAIGQDANGGSSSYSQKTVAIGYEALKVNTDSYETAVGHQALVARTQTAVFPCAAFGNLAGYRVTTGSANTYLGVYNYGCTTGRRNTAVGAFNHGNMTSGEGNVAVGYNGGLDITTGDYNVTIGYLAGADITTGDDNTFIGREAGEKVTTGDDNIAIGTQALDVATAIYDVVAIGRGSMGGDAPGNSNVGVGKLTGNNLDGGTQNTFIGAHSGQEMTSGSNNTFMGAYDGNSGGLDLRTADRNIVLSCGAASPRLYYTHADSSWKSAEIYATTTGDSANMVSLSSGTIARSTSALKYKQDIRDLEEMNIGLLRPVRYKSKCAMDDQTKDHLGIIADEAASSGFEELVTYGADNEVEGFQYERLTVVLLKKIQALEARIATLEAK